MIFKVAAECGFSDYEVYFVGTSDGGYHNLLLAQQVPQSVKLLGINASLVDEDGFVEKLKKIPNIKKLLVYGTEDDDYELVPTLQALGCENLEILTVEGADHEFTDMVDEFIALIDLIERKEMVYELLYFKIKICVCLGSLQEVCLAGGSYA